MALSTKAKKRLEVAMARRVEAKEVADAVDANTASIVSLSGSTAGGTLTSAHILVGNGSNVATDVAVSGDVTLSNAGAVTIGASKVTFAKAKVFISTTQTGTGSSQNVAHGLGTTPTLVLIVPVVTAGAVSIVYGSHTSTNVVTTVTSGDTFKVMAWA